MSTHWLVMDDTKDVARAPYRSRLAAAARHLPATRLTTDELMSTTRHHTHIDLERLTGIHERRVAVGEEDSYSLATMFTDSRAIQRVSLSDTPLLLHEVLDAAGIVIHDIDHVITHQTSARAIRKGMAKVSEVFGEGPRNDAVITVDRYGNIASTTHTVALVEELEAGRIALGETIALIALASGLEIGVVLVPWTRIW